jgi:hypothetical protein
VRGGGNGTRETRASSPAALRRRFPRTGGIIENHRRALVARGWADLALIGDRDEIRDRYLPELRSRGLAPPSERFLEATVERIAGNPIPSVRLVGEGLAQTTKAALGLARLLRVISRPPR